MTGYTNKIPIEIEIIGTINTVDHWNSGTCDIECDINYAIEQLNEPIDTLNFFIHPDSLYLINQMIYVGKGFYTFYSELKDKGIRIILNAALPKYAVALVDSTLSKAIWIEEICHKESE